MLLILLFHFAAIWSKYKQTKQSLLRNFPSHLPFNHKLRSGQTPNQGAKHHQDSTLSAKPNLRPLGTEPSKGMFL